MLQNIRRKNFPFKKNQTILNRVSEDHRVRVLCLRWGDFCKTENTHLPAMQDTACRLFASDRGHIKAFNNSRGFSRSTAEAIRNVSNTELCVLNTSTILLSTSILTDGWRLEKSTMPRILSYENDISWIGSSPYRHNASSFCNTALICILRLACLF